MTSNNKSEGKGITYKISLAFSWLCGWPSRSQCSLYDFAAYYLSPFMKWGRRRCVFVCVHAPHRMLQQQSTRARVSLHEEHSEPAHITRMNLINLEIAWAHLDLVIRLSLFGVVWKPAHFRPKKRQWILKWSQCKEGRESAGGMPRRLNLNAFVTIDLIFLSIDNEKIDGPVDSSRWKREGHDYWNLFSTAC